MNRGVMVTQDKDVQAVNSNGAPAPSVLKRLQRLVCAEHCRYYRPWFTPEPDCEGLKQLISLLKRRGEILAGIERFRHSGSPLTLTHDNLLLDLICARCEHYPYKCAYRKPGRSPGASPCGGIIVYDRLLEARVVSLSDLPGTVDRTYSYFD